MIDCAMDWFLSSAILAKVSLDPGGGGVTIVLCSNSYFYCFYRGLVSHSTNGFFFLRLWHFTVILNCSCISSASDASLFLIVIVNRLIWPLCYPNTLFTQGKQQGVPVLFQRGHWAPVLTTSVNLTFWLRESHWLQLLNITDATIKVYFYAAFYTYIWVNVIICFELLICE